MRIGYRPLVIITGVIGYPVNDYFHARPVAVAISSLKSAAVHTQVNICIRAGSIITAMRTLPFRKYTIFSSSVFKKHDYSLDFKNVDFNKQYITA